ncbi:uncharacterized protein N7483_012225 [Penicillium malachiteum]|uniref:uncharacterized protein n=1 Tax=Penicillium malachiteum TaxID=1324776 RepID=UPI002547EA7C|nr:uncharacterized protein N7483_012225 [Penicillium malachiteum]KAJ5715044.1 hypothetical protein N7483_012225 [Penicillium malachiteum]
MARSIRASVGKRNRANLRKVFFGPVVDARTERLAAKLQEIASQPRPQVEKSEMELEEDKNEMDVDTKVSTSKTRSKSRVQKNKKPRNSIAFKPHPAKGKGISKRK